MKNLDNLEWTYLNEGLKFSLIRGDAGKEILSAYNKEVKNEYLNHCSLLNVLGNFNGKDIVGGSNVYENILLNEILKNEGIRTATPSDIELILKEDKLNFMNNRYTDIGVLLNGIGDINRASSIRLFNQIKKSNKNIELPVIIPLNSLKLIKNKGIFNLLDIELNENPKIISAQQLILEEEKNSKRFNKTNEEGSPLIDLHGNREVYLRRDKGLFRYCFLTNNSISASYSILETSEQDKGITILVKENN